MELVILIGIQASGKSTFAKQQLADTHLRINLDMLRTRHREGRIFETCLETGQRCVIDNTNPTREDRRRYLEPARAAGFRTVGYYFRSSVTESSTRNAAREAPVPDRAIRGTAARLELPSLDEGFDALWYVRPTEGGFELLPWEEEAP